MNSMLRSPQCIIKTDLVEFESIDLNNKKLFQLVKYVTGSAVNKETDYSVHVTESWCGYDSILLEGKNGYIKLALQPLFEVV